MRNKYGYPALISTLCLAAGGLTALPFGWVLAVQSPRPAVNSGPQPTPDVLDVPVLSENPTDVQVGEVVYYYNCMPCHGDHGQGLTDEFRQVWVEDHQNCWAQGCHGGRVSDEGFPIPKDVPAVSARPDRLMRYPSPEELFAYLKNTHPPQRPGALEEDEYWAVTALLLSSNQRLDQDAHVRPEEIDLPDLGSLEAIILYAITTVLVATLLIWQSKSAVQKIQ